MNMREDKRDFKRFSVILKVEAIKKNKRSISGLLKNFSRTGMCVVFDDFKSKINSNLPIKIQDPSDNKLIPASVEVMWKNTVEGKCEVGFKFKKIPSEVKAAILEHAYNKWVKNIPS